MKVKKEKKTDFFQNEFQRVPENMRSLPKFGFPSTSLMVAGFLGHPS